VPIAERGTYEDYSAFIKGVLRPLPDRRNSRSRRKEMLEKLNKEVLVSDEQLKAYINNLIRDDLRVSSFNILSEAKNIKHAVMAYYNFVNAYLLYEEGEDSYGNIACMSIDLAKKLLKETNRSLKRGKN
jgi:Arc/MetJ-type ribon-helix-helix transcriptional regulator